MSRRFTKFIALQEMTADILTKPLPKLDHERLIQGLGMSPD
jgi:hypothetical protein